MLFREKDFEIPWRTVFEANAAAGWGVSIVAMAGATLMTGLPAGPTLWMSLGAGTMGAFRAAQAWKIYEKKFALAGKGISFINPDQLMARIQSRTGKQQKVYIGRGFDWRREHQQRVYDLKKYELREFMPPKWFMELRGKMGVSQASEEAIGAPWIHGVSTTEEDLEVPLEHMEGQTLVLGTTGCGKTRCAETLVSQAIWRGECVIVIDPKFDKDLVNRIHAECKRSGREHDFLFFHPAFPMHSIRFDPLKNFGKVTELASRIAALMPDTGSSSSFKQFAWRAVNIIAQGLVEVYNQPTLSKLRAFVGGGVEGLIEKVAVHWFRKCNPDWEQQIVQYLNRASKGELKKAVEGESLEVTAYRHYYNDVLLASEKRSEVLDGLLEAYQHNREHYAKMVANLLPILDMLTSGTLGKMLSPDADDMDDLRTITDSQQIIKSKAVLYMALDSLPDKTVASAIGSITLADLAAVAGAVYNFETAPNIVSLFVDEAAEVVNEPFLSILNKARGAGFRVTVLTQTLPDFTATMGSEDRALQMLGNLNNMIAMRTKDAKTQEFIISTFGKAYVSNLSYSLGTNSNSASALGSFSGAEGVRHQETLEDLVPQDLLGKLPNFQFFASVSGGRVVKSRIDLLDPVPQDERFTNELLAA